MRLNLATRPGTPSPNPLSVWHKLTAIAINSDAYVNMSHGTSVTRDKIKDLLADPEVKVIMQEFRGMVDKHNLLALPKENGPKYGMQS